MLIQFCLSLFMRTLADRECLCPGPAEPEVTGEPSIVGPEPPLGCPAFRPHEAGALACITVADGAQIYCSALCDSTSEFSSFPLNPYTCGIFTGYQWVDFFNMTHNQLPQCNGIHVTKT